VFLVEKGYVSALREEIASLKRSRTVYDTDPETVRNRVARQSNRLSQLLLQDQKRISRRWSQTLPESRLSLYHDFAADISQSPVSTPGSSSTSPSESGEDPFNEFVQDQLWVNDSVVRDFYGWMSTQGTAQRGLVLRQLQTHFGDSRREILRKPVNIVAIHPVKSEDTLCADVSNIGLEKDVDTVRAEARQAEPVLAVEVSKEKKSFFLKRSKGLKQRTPSTS